MIVTTASPPAREKKEKQKEIKKDVSLLQFKYRARDSIKKRTIKLNTLDANDGGGGRASTV